jgi:hypothetical protein
MAASPHAYAGAELAQNGFVAKLPAGAVIGQGGAFGEGASLGLLFTYGPYGGGTLQHHQGNFAFGQTEYLGFKFNVAGKPHFGWLRIKISIRPLGSEKQTVTDLIDYAYETTPGQSIKAGQTQGADSQSTDASLTSLDGSSSQSARLGLLAAGSPALSIWRRERDRPGEVMKSAA